MQLQRSINTVNFPDAVLGLTFSLKLVRSRATFDSEALWVAAGKGSNFYEQTHVSKGCVTLHLRTEVDIHFRSGAGFRTKYMRRTYLCLDGDKQEVETLPGLMVVKVHVTKADAALPGVEYYAIMPIT